MKLPYVLKTLPTPVRIFIRPLLFISLLLHGVVLMIPISLDFDKTEPFKQEETVKITKIPPAPQPSPTPTPAFTSPQPQPTPLNQLNSVSSSPLTPTPQPANPSSVVIPQSSPQTQPTPQTQKESKPEEPKPSSTETPANADTEKQPTPSESPEKKPESQINDKSTADSNDTQNSSEDDNGIGGSYSQFLNEHQDQTVFAAILSQAEREFDLKKFNRDEDINNLLEANKFKDKKGNPDSRFDFLQKAFSPVTPDQLASSLTAQFNQTNFRFEKVGTYGNGTVYQAQNGEFKRYIILAPGEEGRGRRKKQITAIIVCSSNPQNFEMN